MKPKMYTEYTDEPNCHFCIIDKSKKEMCVGEGTMMPFVTKRIKLEDFLVELFPQFSIEKRIDMKAYINA